MGKSQNFRTDLGIVFVHILALYDVLECPKTVDKDEFDYYLVYLKSNQKLTT